MTAAARMLLALLLLAFALAPVGLHFSVVAPLLVKAGHRAMAVVSLVGAVVWFALWLQALPVGRRAPGCAVCAGRACATPEACQLPIARATRPPAAAFWPDAPRRAWLNVQIALLRWNVDCIGAERESYQAAGCVGALYLRESYQQQRLLMSRIRDLEQRL